MYQRYINQEFQDLLDKACPDGWTPDRCFNNQDSFFSDNEGKYYAKTTIRRWVHKQLVY